MQSDNEARQAGPLERLVGPARRKSSVACEHGCLARQCVYCENEELEGEIERLRGLLSEARQYVMMYSPSGAPFDFPRELIEGIDAALTPNAGINPRTRQRRGRRVECLVGPQPRECSSCES